MYTYFPEAGCSGGHLYRPRGENGRPRVGKSLPCMCGLLGRSRGKGGDAPRGTFTNTVVDYSRFSPRTAPFKRVFFHMPCVKVEARTEIVVNGESITHRQLEALDAVARTGSMSAAAKEMGVSVPVVHRYISNIESAAREPVTQSTPSGTTLTPAGAIIRRRFIECEARCRDDRGYTVCCSPVTSDLVTSVFSALKLTDMQLVVSDDEHNVRMM